MRSIINMLTHYYEIAKLKQNFGFVASCGDHMAFDHLRVVSRNGRSKVSVLL